MFRGREMHKTPSGLLVPDQRVLSNDSIGLDNTILGVHGVCDSSVGFGRLAEAGLIAEAPFNVVSYDRSRRFMNDLLPPNVEGTGVAQAGATEFLLELLEITQNNRISSFGVAGHSMGGAIILTAARMVQGGNLPAALKGSQQRLEELFGTMGINFIASAGITDETHAVIAAHGFAGIELAKVVGTGMVEITKDQESLLHLVKQISRLYTVFEYPLRNPKLFTAECIDACSPELLVALSQLNPEKIALILGEDDPIFTPSSVKRTLEGPVLTNHDFVLWEALRTLPTREVLNVLRQKNAWDTLSERVGYDLPELDNQGKLNLKSLADRAIVLPGSHALPSARPGAKQVADHIKF